MGKLNYSRQREAIRDYLKSTTSHPTADEIYQHIKEIYPNISLGTVYRNLSLLTSNGDIQKLAGNDEFEHYDANTDVHYHFLCDKCHRVFDVDMTPLTTLETTAKNVFPGEITSHTAIFFGTCNCCLKTD